jgi:hypothetical protein
MSSPALTMADAISSAKVLMQPAERLLLFSLVRALRPTRVLEIGTHKGGSAMIIVAALDDVGAGSLVCIDPEPLVAEEDWNRVAHRAILLPGGSPDVLEEALAVSDGPIDFAFIDGDHGYAGVVRDIVGVVPLMADGGYLLFHDAHFCEVRQAIDFCLQRFGGRLLDCGMLSVEQNPEADRPDVVWGGLRLLRFMRQGRTSGRELQTSSGFSQEEGLAQILMETTRLMGGEAARAAQALIDPLAFPIDYLAECRSLWKEGPLDFVNGLYRLLLDREPDASGAEYYLGRLRTGDTRLDVVRLIAFSEEARDRGLRTDWLEQLERVSPTFPIGRHFSGASWNRKLRSWVRRQPTLARAARYAMVAGRTPWTVERLHALVAEQQQALEQQRRQIQELERHVGSDPGSDETPPLGERLMMLSGQVKLQNRALARLVETVERLARDSPDRRS